MHPLLTVLTKTLVREFYRQHAGLLLVVLLLAGGFLSAREHYALATYAVHDAYLLSAYLLIWLLYTALATRFAAQTFWQEDFLGLLRLVPPFRRLRVLYAVALPLLTPVLAYAGYVFTVGWLEGARGSLAVLSGSVVLLSLLPLLAVEYALRFPSPRFRLSLPLPGQLTTPYPLFFLRHLLHHEPLTLLLTKAGSLLVLAGVCALYPTDDYDLRLLLLGALLAAALHAGLVYQLYRFEAVWLRLARNLPIPPLRRAVLHALILALLLVPEALLLIRNQPAAVTAGETISVWCLLTGLVFGLYSLLWLRHRSPDQLMPLVFGMVILYFFPVMYQLPAFLLGLGTLLLALLLFVLRYPNAEPAFSD